MKLTESLREAYREQGFLYFPGLLDSREVAALNAASTELQQRDGPEVRRGDGGQPKIVYAPHASSDAFALVTRLPRILGVVEQLLAERAYVYQSRINLKLPFTGDAWSWHQDFPAWHRGDGMPRPHAVMCAIFLHECNVANGPLLVIPKSQREDLAEILGREENVQGYEVQRVATHTLRTLAETGGIADLCGPAGSVAFIHPTLMHGSAPNLTPWPRSIYYVNFNAVSNRTERNQRAWYMNNTDATPMDTVRDDALSAAR
jgi:ectoine hydroxylase